MMSAFTPRQLLIPAGIMVVLASTLLPLPALLLDFMLVANLLLALILMISTLYLSEPLKLSSLPTILLLTTLYRLALNISTTRMILGSGEIAGTVEAFGTVVIQDSLIVGLVVFLVITLVQFIVVAKGAERVAEVAARFTLDALPGKQMSIDADVRAGLIDFETARLKRQELQIESRFYGALDGAMKFVKGDAIAGLVITAINICGGLAVGLIVEGLDITGASSKYTTLTIGDGLLSQIPSLLNSLAAGLVVTRVGRGDNAHLAAEIPAQLGGIRVVRVIVAAVAFLLACLPGLPALPFVVLATTLLVSTAIAKSEQKSVSNPGGVIFEPRPPPVLQIELSQLLLARLAGNSQIASCLDRCRQEAFERWGLILAPPELTICNDPLPLVSIKMRGLAAISKKISDSDSDINALITTMMTDLLTQRAVEFVDDILTRRTLDFFDRYAPELVSAVVPELASVTKITSVLRGLIAEGITIRNFDLILQSIAEAAQKVGGERQLLQEVRIALKRVICQKYSSSDGSLNCISINPLLDMALAQAESHNRMIDPQDLKPLTDFLTQDFSTNPVIVVSKNARALLRDYLKLYRIEIAVLAHEEIVPEIKLNPIAEINMGEQDLSETLLEQIAA